MNRIVILILLVLFTLRCQAQDGALEEYFFESGKIKVVIAVALSIAAGMFTYLFRLDKKIQDLENNKK
ncbi:MAG: hypothetical protein QNL21_08200 [Flavobacteriales bacterium]|jgi:hypothetical protein